MCVRFIETRKRYPRGHVKFCFTSPGRFYKHRVLTSEAPLLKRFISIWTVAKIALENLISTRMPFITSKTHSRDERRRDRESRWRAPRVFTLRKTKRCVVSFFWQTNYTPFHSVAENVFVQLAQKMIAGERNRFLKTKFIFTVYTTNE